MCSSVNTCVAVAQLHAAQLAYRARPQRLAASWLLHYQARHTTILPLLQSCRGLCLTRGSDLAWLSQQCLRQQESLPHQTQKPVRQKFCSSCIKGTLAGQPESAEVQDPARLRSQQAQGTSAGRTTLSKTGSPPPVGKFQRLACGADCRLHFHGVGGGRLARRCSGKTTMFKSSGKATRARLVPAAEVHLMVTVTLLFQDQLWPGVPAQQMFLVECEQHAKGVRGCISPKMFIEGTLALSAQQLPLASGRAKPSKTSMRSQKSGSAGALTASQQPPALQLTLLLHSKREAQTLGEIPAVDRPCKALTEVTVPNLAPTPSGQAAGQTIVNRSNTNSISQSAGH